LAGGKRERRRCEHCVAGADRDLIVVRVSRARIADEFGLQHLAGLRNLDTDRYRIVGVLEISEVQVPVALDLVEYEVLEAVHACLPRR
jgi:hypothetical protein